jgi:ribose 5-phosphate isomerase B
MRIALGSDHAGFDLKMAVKRKLQSLGYAVDDFGTGSPERTDYQVYAHRVGRAVAARKAAKGVLVCGSGIGMCIAANKVPGVRAALAYSVETARLSRAHNDANVLCLGARTMDRRLVFRMIDAWLSTAFEGGRHAKRVNALEDVDDSAKPARGRAAAKLKSPRNRSPKKRRP